jgi:hypothetical protein
MRSMEPLTIVNLTAMLTALIFIAVEVRKVSEQVSRVNEQVSKVTEMIDQTQQLVLRYLSAPRA